MTDAHSSTGPCLFRLPTGEQCKRPRAHESGVCVFHGAASTEIDKFRDALNMLISSKDGEWRSFIFPDGFDFIGTAIDYKVDASFASFRNLRMENARFQELRLDHS